MRLQDPHEGRVFMTKLALRTMPIYRLTNDAIQPLPETTFMQHGVRERSDLQRLLRANIEVVAPDVLVIAEEFAEWEDDLASIRPRTWLLSN